MQLPKALRETGVPTSRLFTHVAGKLVLVVVMGPCFSVHGPLRISWAWAASQHGDLNSNPSIEKGRGRGRKRLFLFLN